jgi:rSAM/selenodomain-associated transferase 1
LAPFRSLWQSNFDCAADELQGDRMDDADRFTGPPFGPSMWGDVPANGHRTRASCGIAFMAKASVPGRAKTRLVPPLTYEQAADLNTAFLQDVAANLLLAGGESERSAIVGYAAYGPPGSDDFFRRILPESIGLIEAWLPNFGDCLFHTIREILARGHDSAVVLNSDSPTLPTSLLVETAEVLARPGDRAVLGPSTDGGYYLLGLKAAHRRMFDDITWSTERVAGETLQRAREIGLPVHILPAWYDIDDVDGLRRVETELSASYPAGSKTALHTPHHAAHTAKLIDALAREHNLDRPAARRLAADAMRA